MIFVLLFVSLLATSDLVTASSDICVLRSAESGDVVFNTNDTTCATSTAHNATNIQQCPEDNPTFLTGENCCVQDQALLNGCDLQLTANNTVINTTRIPVVFVTNETLHIYANGSSSVAVIGLRQDPDSGISCGVMGNITLISEQESPALDIEIRSDNSIQIVPEKGNVSLNGVYKTDLGCNHTVPSTATKQCLFFKLVNSLNEVLHFTDTNTTGSNNTLLETCPNGELNTTTATLATTLGSTDPSTTTEEQSIWLMYNRLLLYVVVGGGCGLGLVLVFIIMLCLLTGCLARRKRIRARRKHQLETAPIRRNRNPDRARGSYQRNLSYSFTNPGNEENVPEEIALPQPAPQLIRAEVPTVPRILALAEEDDQVTTFNSFKRPPKGVKPDTPTTPEPGYYETVVPTIHTTTDDEPTETYDTLIHQAVSLKHGKIGVNSSGQYSQLNMSKSNNTPENAKAQPYSLPTPRSQRTPSTPPPLPPPLSTSNAIELLDRRTQFSKDILTSSWSKPSTMDRAASKHTAEVQEIYDFPTALNSTTAKQQTGKTFIKVGEGESEVIYDVPPTRKVSESTSIGSYVDMQLGVL